MSQQLINIGAVANDGTGDQLRDAFDKINDNTTESYTGLVPVARPTAPAASIGATGDVAGMVAFDASYIYVCTIDYDGITDIWTRAAAATWV